MRVDWEDVTEEVRLVGEKIREGGRSFTNELFDIVENGGKSYLSFLELDFFLEFDTDQEAKDYVQALFELPLNIKELKKEPLRAEQPKQKRESCQFTVHGWMVEKLKLSGNELLVFALIYGFTQGVGRYSKTSYETADLLGISRRTIMTIFKNLTDNGHLIKEDEYNNNVKSCFYKIAHKGIR